MLANVRNACGVLLGIALLVGDVAISGAMLVAYIGIVALERWQ